METKRVARRNHSAEFKEKVLAACGKPGASVAAIAMRNGLNANVIYRWLRDRAQTTEVALVSSKQTGQPTSFLPVQLPSPVAQAVAVAASPEIRMELRRGASSVIVSWPLQCSGECAAWLREWLR